MEYHGNFSAANRQGENEVLEVLMDENEMIMTDEELMVACEFTPYNRQSTLIPLLLEASCAAKVAAPYVRRLSTVQERAVFALHSMYLLGVQRRRGIPQRDPARERYFVAALYAGRRRYGGHHRRDCGAQNDRPQRNHPLIRLYLLGERGGYS